jgi:FKBP-type peptidyl-prolyl cis-trans isomerase FklB
MKSIFPKAVALALLLVSSAVAEDEIKAPDPKKVSYALGMNLALQSKQVGVDLDVNTVIQAIKDVQQGKPTRLKPAELPVMFKQEEDFSRAQITARDLAAGKAFLAANAAKPGVKTLADGLQYRVLKDGNGPIPKSSDVVSIKYRGRLIDGTEFTESDHLETSMATQMRGWQEAIEHMKVGSKWEVYLPPNLAYGRNWLSKVGPESTVIFELELDAITAPSAQSDGPRVIPQ